MAQPVILLLFLPWDVLVVSPLKQKQKKEVKVAYIIFRSYKILSVFYLVLVSKYNFLVLALRFVVLDSVIRA